MLVLGISGGFRIGYQDASACLVENGKILAAVEEERLNRIKFSPGRLPYLSILEVLQIAGKTIQEVDIVAFHGSTWGADFDVKLQAYFLNHFGFSPVIKRFHHHDCHAASAYYASGFNRALIFTLDSSGDGISLQVSRGEGIEMKVIQRSERPDSLGIFYSMITQYCGFTKESDEYKLMGLSSYGQRDAFDFSWLISAENGVLKLNQEYLVSIPPLAPSPHKDEMLFSEAFIQKMRKPRRLPQEAMDTFYQDVAASAQVHLEKLMLQLALHYTDQTGIRNICLAGGAALNCVMNQQLMNAPFTEQIFIQPAAGDAGIAMGAAYLATAEAGIQPVAASDTYLGRSFTNAEVEKILQVSGLEYTFTENPAEEAAELIASNKVIGWFQGRMEFGSRALGNRSILANPCHASMQQTVNEKIKFRESFRPFCPSVLEEDASAYFEGKQFPAPYMTITYDVAAHVRQHIPAVTHIDGTARIQTVNQEQNPRFYALLKALKAITGHGIVLNTSFNLSHEPIVGSPRDAIAAFFASGMDVLFIENYRIEKWV